MDFFCRTNWEFVVLVYLCSQPSTNGATNTRIDLGQHRFVCIHVHSRLIYLSSPASLTCCTAVLYSPGVMRRSRGIPSDAQSQALIGRVVLGHHVDKGIGRYFLGQETCNLRGAGQITGQYQVAHQQSPAVPTPYHPSVNPPPGGACL